MTDIESRLRDAFAAQGDAVPYDPTAYAAVVRRRRRRRGLRWMRAGAAIAAAAAVPALVLALRPAPGGPDGDAAVAPAPTRVIAIVGEQFMLLDAETLRGTGLAPSGWEPKNVASAGDGRSFWTVSFTKKAGMCESLIQRLEVDGMNVRVADEITLPDYVTYLALSPDGRRLAYLARTRLPGTTRCANGGEIRVRDLRTGAERVWDDGKPVETSPFMLTSMTWSPDGRHLALGGEYAVLDTTAPGDAVVFTDQTTIRVGNEMCWTRDRAFRGRTGELVATLVCKTEQSGAYVLDADGVNAVRLLFRPPTPEESFFGVSFDDSGDHAFVSGGPTLMRWDRDRGLYPVDMGRNVQLGGYDW